MPFDTAHDDSANPVDVHVGARLRHFRHMRNKSQVELGDALGVTFQQVQKYERGANRLSASSMHAACTFLACTPNDLFSGLPLPDAQPETPAETAARLALQTREGQALLAAFRACAQDDQMVLLALAKRLQATAQVRGS